MAANIVNQVAFLRTSREFPPEIQQLSIEVDKSYIDIANAVNNRIISIFPTNNAAINGESWFITKNQKQQAFRQVFIPTITAGAFNPVTHGIKNIVAGQFIRCFGEYTDGTNSYGLIYGSNGGGGSTTIPGQINFYVSPTQIVFLADAAAPAPTSGLVVLEWISRV
jgi:hypothetical protein